MAISFVGAGAVSTNAGALASVAIPAGRQAGDILVLVAGSANETIATPSGWASVTTFPGFGTGIAGASGAIAISVFWKRSDGTETTVAIADSGDKNFATVYAFRGCVATGTPLIGKARNSGTNSTLTNGAITMNAVSALLFITASGTSTVAINAFTTAIGTMSAATAQTSSAVGTSGFRYQAGYILAPGITSQGSPSMSSTMASSIPFGVWLGELLAEVDTAAITGVVANVQGAVTVHNKDAAAITGVIAAVEGALAVHNKDAVAIVGVVADVVGSANIVLAQTVSLAGVVADVEGQVVLLDKDGVFIAGAVADVEGAADIVLAQSIAFVGVVADVGGAADVANKNGLALVGVVADVEGSAVVDNSEEAACYDIADDRRELILARLADVLADVEGVVSFKRNDPSVAAALTPAVLMLDGDETAGVPRGWDRGRPAPFPMVASSRPEVYIMVEAADGDAAGVLLDLLQKRMVSAVLNDSTLISLCVDGDLRYEGAQTAFALGSGIEGEMGVNFTFNYLLIPAAPCFPLDLPTDTGPKTREAVLGALARAIEVTEGVATFKRNELTLPEDAPPAVFLLDGDESVDPAFYQPGRPATVPKPVVADPEVYAIVVANPDLVGPALNRLRYMLIRSILNDPLLTLLAADGDIRYDGCQTGLALGRSLAGEMGLKFSVRYVLNP